jgi:adenylate cyclase
MAEEKFRRKLTAILSADVAGYSRLMGEDEEATVRMLTAHREMMGTLIQKHQDRVVDSPWDNLLAEFASVLDAVRCAVEIQEELKARNAEFPDDRKMEFRIGINLGDVIEEGERIYGDGINIAARVEGLAEPGGICISGTVYEHIKDKLALWEEYLGEHTVKNIKHPVRVYRVRMEPGAEAPKVSIEETQKPKPWKWAILGAVVVLVVAAGGWAIWNFHFRPPPIEPASVDKMAFPLPDKPSIAVLPFINMSEDKKQEYFSDGITEEIIMGLSKVPDLFVIARNSTFVYKGKPVNIQQVSKELGVRYVLEGSVRKAEDRVRITAQLIDATTGNHVWSDRYDRDLKDIFALQDEITMKIMTALQVKLTEGQTARLTARGTKNLEAYLKCLEAREHLIRMNKESNALAKEKLKEAIALDPHYPAAYYSLGGTHFMDIWLRTTDSPKRSLGEAIKFLKKAISLDPLYGDAHALLGFFLVYARQYEKAVAEAEKGVALCPSSAESYGYLGSVLRYVGRSEEAIQAYKKALRLNPFPPTHWIYGLGIAYLFTGQCEKAIEQSLKAVHLEPRGVLNHVTLTAVYGACGREDDARSQAKELLKIQPNFSVEYFGKRLTHKNDADKELILNGLRKAGLK